MTAQTKQPKASYQGAKKKAHRKPKETISLDMPFQWSGGQETSFTRADLVFTGIDHSGISYEVRVFLNNTGAHHKTPRDPVDGYAGRFVVFGHGDCFGDVGHCDVPAAASGGSDRHLQHPITPQKKTVTITEPLLRVLEDSEKGLETVTLVPVSKVPKQSERGPAPEALKHPSVSLRTYR